MSAAAASGHAVMLDFYADWCVSCKEMERYTFTNPQVRAALSQMTLLRADVTANNGDDQALLKRFGIFGPPTIAFYGGDGHERSDFRVVGYMKAADALPICWRARPRRRELKSLEAGAHSAAQLVALAGAAAGFLTYRHYGGTPARRRSGSDACRDRPPAPCREPPRRRHEPRPPAIPDEVPDMKLPDLAGKPHALRAIPRPSADLQFLGHLVRALPARNPAPQYPAERATAASNCRSSASRSIPRTPCRRT